MKYKNDQSQCKLLKLISNKIFTLTLLFVLIFSPQSSTAYTSGGGLETGDIVDIDYEGILEDGEIFDPGPTLFNQEVKSDGTSGSVITGFYEGLLGMKVGDRKEIVVQPEDGYTSPSHNLYNKVLIFNVYIVRLVENVRGDDGEDDSGSGTFAKIVDVFTKIAGTVLVIGAFAYMWNFRTNVQIPNCVHCESIGRKHVNAEGKCKKCGNGYCRASFSKGCPNCHANSFVPLK